tara:strand:+ start:1660 stop:2886 length:1227 start_codon:yes stop_codon:yes gene_type:complete
MAVTQNTFTQLSTDGNTRSFTFEYLKKSDVKVTVAGTAKTEGNGADQFIFSNATTIQFNTTPATGDFIRIYRETADTNLSATFYAGSAIKSQDLNDNFTQNLYVTQEVRDNSDLALSNSREHDGDGTYTSAVSKSNTAISTANTASTNASAAVTTANTASTNASNAVSTANTASTNATNAVNTANSATTTANSAVTTANAATATANTASTNASSAVTTANSATTTANSAVTTANSAVTTANAATATANTASTNASNAVTTANAASATATASANTVANSAIYQVVANYAALPALSSVDDGKFYQVTDTTSIENNFSSITGEPSNFVGHSGLTVKLKSNTTASPKVWEWQEYYANDPETRYRKKIIVENLNTIDEDYTITANNNAFSVGPVTVAANKTVTINANSLYFIG